MADIKWIKITTDIFDDEKILLIESLPDAYAIIVVWFKLLCLAGKMNNSGVFILGDKIAYTDKMLSTIFRMKETTVTLALQTFEQFGMIEIVDGVITIPNWGKHQSIDKIEAYNAYHKEYQREYRKKQKAICDVNSKVNDKVNSKVNVNPIEEDKKRIDKNRLDKKKTIGEKFFPDDKLNDAFKDYIEFRRKTKKPMTDKAIELAIIELAKLSNGDNDKAIAILNQSILNGWAGLYELKQKQQKGIDWESL